MDSTNFNFTIGDAAAKRIKHLISKEPHPDKTYLRIDVNGGGCSGFQYKFAFTEQTCPSDCFFYDGDQKLVVIDGDFKEFINNSTLNFIENLTESFFAIENPNATSKCGCGSSFGI
jgi:iron-sulfur cluster insertion protein